MKMRHGLCAAANLALVLGFASSTMAQHEGSGFALNRFDPAERGSDWFVLDSLDLRGNKRHAIGDTTEFAYKPLVLYSSDGSETGPLVKVQAFTHLGASLVMWNRVRFGLNFPVLFWQNGEKGAIGTTTYESSNQATIGDIRVGGDVRLWGNYGDAVTGAAGLQVFVPSGDRASYTGDAKVRLVPRVMVAGDAGAFAYAAKLGLNIRPQDEAFANTPMGSEIGFGLAAGMRALDKTLLIGPELYGSTGVTASDAFLKKRTTPLELLVGVHYRLMSELNIGLGLGPGLSRGFGSPLFRAVASIEWHPRFEAPPPPPPPDRDRDGIVDVDDACPDVPGVRTEDRRTDGCPPPPPDRDNDGVIDVHDACPDVRGAATQETATNGCPPPPPDRDNDGVVDADDACPDASGVATQDPKMNGCPPPPPDRDTDGVLDPEDACPDLAGPKDPDPKKNGCPAARVEGGQIKITQQIKFALASAKILPESDPILTAVQQILEQHPEITKVSVEGHTDNQGKAAANLELSKQRAAAVAAWLVKHGIDKKRLVSVGFGQQRPIDSNESEPGRQNNGRVEFDIVPPKEVSAPSGSSAPPSSQKPGKPAPSPALPARPEPQKK